MRYRISLIIVLLWTPVLASAQSGLPEAAVAPVAALGDLSEGQIRILKNRLDDQVSPHFKVISQQRYKDAEDAAFESLEADQCTEENCIRKIQELLQVENLFVLQIIKDGGFVQLSLTKVGLDEKRVVSSNCTDCSIAQLLPQVDTLVERLEGTPRVVARNSLGTGQVFLLSKPNNAEIILDGRRLEELTDALLEEVLEGEHQLELTKGNLTAARTITVLPDTINRVELELTLAKVPLQVNSKPSEATVLLDGKEIGKTPLLQEIKAGNHKILVNLQGYLPFEKDFSATPRNLSRVEAILAKGGYIQFTKLDHSQVVEVNEMAVQPDNQGLVLLHPGEKQVRITQAGYSESHETIEIVAGMTHKVDASLKPIQGSFRATGKPEGANVQIRGGEFVPISQDWRLPHPGSLLPIGEYKIVVSAEGFIPESLYVEIKEQQASEVSFSLKVAPGSLMVKLYHSAFISIDEGQAEYYHSWNRIIRELEPGPHSIRVYDIAGKYEEKNEQFVVSSGQEIRLAFSLDFTQAYLTQMERERDKTRYERELTEWQTKLGWSLGAGLATGLYSLYEYRLMLDANSDWEKNVSKMENSASSERAQPYRKKAKAASNESQTHELNAQLSGLVSLGLLGLTVKYYFEAPTLPTSIGWYPFLKSDGQIALRYQQRW